MREEFDPTDYSVVVKLRGNPLGHGGGRFTAPVGGDRWKVRPSFLKAWQ
jgi:hypothetical protein